MFITFRIILIYKQINEESTHLTLRFLFGKCFNLIWTFSKCLNLFEVPDFSQCGLWPLANASRALVEGNFAIDSALAPGH